MPSQVRSRRVHYISGFDPRGARFYHRLYRAEAAKQSAHSGASHRVGARERLTPAVSVWKIQSQWAEHTVETDYHFMEWTDVIRQHWDERLRLLLRSVPVYLHYLAFGGFNRVAKVSKNAFYTAIFPLLYIAAFSLGTLGLLGLLGIGMWRASGSALLTGGLLLVFGLGLGTLGVRLAERIGVTWLLRTCVFLGTWGTRRPPELDQRASEIAEHILAEQRERPREEVLIVGHSVGSMLAACVVAKLLQTPRADPLLGSLRLVTLGQCIPYLGVMPGAASFREELRSLANDPRIPWTDFTAPPDPLCFFQVHPIQASGIPCSTPERPRQVSVRVFPMFTAATYARIRRNKLRIHFQYLMASELPSDYDYFRLTAGPGSLADHALSANPLDATPASSFLPPPNLGHC
jgi:pimeloyl-ACP methyl ester carboxylesterase